MDMIEKKQEETLLKVADYGNNERIAFKEAPPSAKDARDFILSHRRPFLIFNHILLIHSSKRHGGHSLSGIVFHNHTLRPLIIINILILRPFLAKARRQEKASCRFPLFRNFFPGNPTVKDLGRQLL